MSSSRSQSESKPADPTVRLRGTVKWFDERRGYGFILGAEGSDIFVHYSAIQGEGFRSILQGDEVEYVLIEGERGWFADEVMVLRELGGDAEESSGEAD